MEALKQMLFTMQDMAHHESLDNGDTDYYKVTPYHETLRNVYLELGNAKSRNVSLTYSWDKVTLNYETRKGYLRKGNAK